MFFDGSDPMTAKGFAGWVVAGALAGIVALALAGIFPSIIPARAAAQRL